MLCCTQGSEYKLAGFPGAVGSTDATHILIERLQCRFRQSHIGFKMTHTARTYNVTVNHRRQILSTTKGHPARWNDKTLATFDDFMQMINDGTILNDVRFELYDLDDNDGSVVMQTYQGAWLLVDNGYHSWATTVPPIKTTMKKSEIRFSSWLESMRKDVECTFGILKGRWRILKSGIRVSGVECADNIFLSCCALHNWLLEIDGLDTEWRHGVPSDWEGAIGNEVPIAQGNHILPDAIRRLLNPVAQRTTGIGDQQELSVLQQGEHSSEELELQQQQHQLSASMTHAFGEPRPVPTVISGVKIVRNLSLPFFQSKLVRHFDIAFRRNEIQWPRHLARKHPPASNL